MANSKVSPLPFNVAIADPETGNPTPFFARQLGQLLDEAIATAVEAAAAAAAAAAAQATADAAVPQTRLINTTSPIGGGGPLTSDLTLTHAVSGVTAGVYTNANITVDAKGHVTVAANGSSGGTGSVTSVSVTTANGVSGSVANATTTPAITITLGAITPTSVAASGNVTGSNLSGTNTGDQTTVSGNAGSATILQTGRNFSIAGGGITASAVSFNGSAVVTLVASVDAGHITLARMANLAANSFIGNNTGSPATPLALTAAQAKTLLAIGAADVSGLGYFATGTSAANLTGVAPASTLPIDAVGAADAYLNVSGLYIDTQPIAASTVAAGLTNRMFLYPWVPSRDRTITQIGVEVTTGVAAANAKVVVYDNDATTNGPNNLLKETGNLDCSSNGFKGEAWSYTFLKGVRYWLGTRHSSTATLRAYTAAGTLAVGRAAATGAGSGNNVFSTLAFATPANNPYSGLAAAQIGVNNLYAVLLLLA